ncbi:cytochrome P450, putative [Ricinus communis]|uniref:Cytochrome P450, putative n=2 Tax=Ricinus communis TaxID=3988 RepID=B9SDG5_RICCO|nr:cytochrome P450, putative [Ricinus communis]|eukprot:XP_002524034.1 cytochrome P450 89A2 [Ricinus communis]
METWYLVLILIISITSFLPFKSLFPIRNLPPGPLSFNLMFLRNSVNLEAILRSLHSKFGPIYTLYMGHIPVIFIADHSLAHQALVQNSAIFADRPPDFAISKVLSSNQLSVTTGFYGPTWRLLRRNLTSKILHPLRVKSYGRARKRVFQILRNRIGSQAKSGHPVFLSEHFHFSLFALSAFMCFGDKLDEDQIKQTEKVQREILLCYRKYNRLNFLPRLTKIFMRRQWDEFFQIRKNQENVLIPLIKARKKLKEVNNEERQYDFTLSYVDTLFDLEHPEEKRKLHDDEMVSLCSEFLNAGADATATTLEWIMANLVKYPEIQEKILVEIKGVIKDGEEEVKEGNLQKMPYLKAVVLEGLRRHPPAHFVLPHAVTQDAVLHKYLIPKNGIVSFLIADIGLDPKVWEDPMAFKPERFLNDEGKAFDITGSREIKMMPFGAGRRICPGYGLAMLLLEYFVANLIWNFEWRAVDGDEIDLSEKPEFTVVMKNPLQAQISPRFIK